MSNGQIINANAWYSVGKLTLTPGIWIAIGNATIMTQSNENATLYQRIVNGDASKIYAADAVYTYLSNKQITAIVNVEATHDVFLQVYASKHAGIYANTMTAIKLK